MADIAPFRALRFNLDRVGGDAARVLAPPYDVISDADRAALEARHDHNIVRLDLPRGEGDQRYQNARALLDAWIADGTLKKDDAPGIYRYEQTFQHPPGGKTYVRKGFISLLRLTPFSDRVVLPHEHTLSGPKVDRQKLIKTTLAHFSQVFVLYRDPQGRTDAAFRQAEDTTPIVDTTTPDGCRHRLWQVNAPATIREVTAAMADKSVMIADGHHRYETMVGLAGELRPADRAPGESLADWGTIFFARAEDPGLLVLPTHRLVKNLPDGAMTALREKAKPWFDLSEGTEESPEAIESRLVREGERRVTFALREAGRSGVLWMGLRADANLSSLGPPALQGLDVTVLHGLVLGPLLGIDKEAMARQANLLYTHDTPEALAKVAHGDVQGAFLMNATKVEQVLAACEAGFVLPQKSTYFQPKLATGLVMARIEPQEKPTRA